MTEREAVTKAIAAIDAAYTAVTHMGISDCEGAYRAHAMKLLGDATQYVVRGAAAVECSHLPSVQFDNETWKCTCGKYRFNREFQ